MSIDVALLTQNGKIMALEVDEGRPFISCFENDYGTSEFAATRALRPSEERTPGSTYDWMMICKVKSMRRPWLLKLK